ncbi:hypothetical protein FUAX_12630 [Fulvitalea axinellae]|uniref:FtsX-like permease family protein n=1 Tax=Fulvitalea axinellae TaxID=1182444 RepID=A0AAU9D7I5_9BACT|nr:hypothetical protein FUAX_12630 [Fulvitalea axinellae]
MLFKLQKKTLSIIQIAGYALSLFFGLCVILLFSQLYLDLKPLLNQESNVFKQKTAVVSKTVSAFKSVDKSRLYFNEKELSELKEQSFVQAISAFNNATFRIKATSPQLAGGPVFTTDLFFESIPDQYLDVESPEWNWKIGNDFIPIIIPENYINLYNFGFAESQGLPVISKTTVSEIEFTVSIFGRGKSKRFKSRIVGFSDKINSILVPETFLNWANKNYGERKESKTSRLLVEFKNISDESVARFFNEHNYAINKASLEQSRLLFFFNSIFYFVFFVAALILALSCAFILLSVHLVIQKNKETIQNLFFIGYEIRQIAYFYRILISGVTLICFVFATVFCLYIRNQYLNYFRNTLEFQTGSGKIVLISFILCAVFIPVYYFIVGKYIRKTVSN